MTLPSKLSRDEISERFSLIHEQEINIYKCEDYLSPEFQEIMHHDSKASKFNYSMHSPDHSSSLRTAINDSCREKICEWSFQVIDHFHFNREIVSISLNYLDRYLSICTVNRKKFQLAAVTCLYLAIKLYGSSALKISSFVELSRGYFSADHIVAMEDAILRTLSWYVHPPTPLNAVRHFLYLFPVNNNNCDCLHKVKELSRFLTELSVCDYYFINYQASTIGLGALLAAIELAQKFWEPDLMEHFLQDLKSITFCDPKSRDVINCKTRLKETYTLGGFCDHQQKEVIGGDKSPVCVSQPP